MLLRLLRREEKEGEAVAAIVKEELHGNWSHEATAAACGRATRAAHINQYGH